MSEAPPTYTQQDDHEQPERSVPLPAGTTYDGIQILITPANNATEFQVGHLGADDEPASIEGEVQIKGATDAEWARM